ncbi:hypothetical protein AAGV33_16115 [Flavobacterium sp. FBOR7N2.3]|uniref:Uncharacterized protein n=1 Tax=Flavobacterium magnesitis TaxID=3138077 RepID=A0ABV4TRP4_9FLAO
MHYNATLCKEALGKVFVALHHLSFGVINFWHTKTFGALGRSVNWKLKLHFITKRKSILVIKNEISEMKQTAALALGILGLKTVFVQVNEIMSFCK